MVNKLAIKGFIESLVGYDQLPTDGSFYAYVWWSKISGKHNADT